MQRAKDARDAFVAGLGPGQQAEVARLLDLQKREAKLRERLAKRASRAEQQCKKQTAQQSSGGAGENVRALPSPQVAVQVTQCTLQSARSGDAWLASSGVGWAAGRESGGGAGVETRVAQLRAGEHRVLDFRIPHMKLQFCQFSSKTGEGV